MRSRSETILLLEAHPYSRSQYARVLNALGYWQLLYANYTEGAAVGNATAFDAVVAVWTDSAIAPERLARVLTYVTGLPRVRGALVVSPFTTAHNARLLARSGARGWARPPVSHSELGARLACLLHGDRRFGGERRVAVDRPPAPDRRREPVYPVAVPA